MRPETISRRFALPAMLRAHARTADGADRPPVAAARSAATVTLVRDRAPVCAGDGGSAGVEVFVLRRVPTMAFAPEALVFPGGGVDERDDALDIPWAGPPPQRWADDLDLGRADDVGLAGRLVVAAAREVFEECGVLLAGRHPDDVVADVSGPEWASDRADLVSRELSFGRFLRDRGLVLRSDLLRAHARWVTPDFEPRRYDTIFFAALCPPGQRPDDRTSEASEADWLDPTDVLRRHEAGEVVLLPPTVVAMERLTKAASAASFVAAAPAWGVVRPVLAEGEAGLELVAEVPR